MRIFGLNRLVRRTRYRLRRHGLKGMVGAAIHLARLRVHLDEAHVWYELPLEAERPRMRLPSALSLVRAGADELPLIDDLPTVSFYEARRRMDAGHDLWLVLKDQRPVFACWVFHGSVTTPVVKKGWIPLPDEIVCFEDSISAPIYRGRGIPLAAWPAIADHLERTPAQRIITKTEKDDATARRAFEKAGFREIATVWFRLSGFRQRAVVVPGSGATADWLVDQLTR